MEVYITHKQGSSIPVLFSEELGWVLEVLESDVSHCLNVFQKHKVLVYKIGKSIGFGVNAKIAINVKNACIESTVRPLMRMWEETSYRLELQQTIKECADSEFNSLATRSLPKYVLTFDPDEERVLKNLVPVKVAVLREEGTNGDREMAAALARVGFKVWDVTMQDLISGDVTLDQFRGLIFPGGFSYADVLGSAKGWAGAILFNDRLKKQFEKFYERPDTFSLGVCNGCQLMALIGWVGSNSDIMLEHNLSERFECRWSTVKIEKSNSIMLQGMEGSIFGVWVAHGEGRFTFKTPSAYDTLVDDECVSLRFVDDNGSPTEVYPLNPNGSIGGLAGVCSKNGRHLAMMPHPERCVQPFQWPYTPGTWHYQRSPWEKMFRNAFEWCNGVQFHTVYY